MKNLQQTFDSILALKHKQKELKSIIRDSLNTPELKSINEQIIILKEKKKTIESQIMQSNQKELQELDYIKQEIELSSSMLSDIALTQYVQGESTEVVDLYSNIYDPIFQAKFKKSGNKKPVQLAIGLE